MATQRGQRLSRQSESGYQAEALEARRMLDATITARVFYDYNGNGVYEPAAARPEEVAGNYRVFLDANSNGQPDAGEVQLFTGPGGVVSFTVPAGSTHNVTVAARDVEGVSTPLTYVVTAGADGSTTNAGDFGIIRSNISGRVFRDNNGNGIYDAGDVGLQNTRVFLDINKNGIFDAGDIETWTAPAQLPNGDPNPNAGSYRFAFIDAGNYEVRVFPAHYQDVVGQNPILVNLGIAETQSGKDFALVNKSAIGGVVFNDLNGDGIRQGNETLRAGVRVYADINNNNQFDPGEPSALSTATLSPQGTNYVIERVEPGTYTVRVVLPDGITSSTPTSRTIPLVAGQETVFTNFGLVGQTTPPPPTAANDFNGDGKSDIIVTQGTTSTVWYMDGTTRIGTANLPNLGAGYTLAAYGDFDGDGKPDLLVHNASTGVPKIITLNGLAVKNEVVLPAANTQWKPVGAGDFDGDGDLDIVWRNQTTGQNTTWRMNGTALESFKALPSTADNNWFVVGVGDFDGDGDEDIVWRHAVTGRNTTWLLNNTSTPAFKALPSTADQNWRPVAITAFNNDNIPDILWIHSQTGQNSVWLMNPTGQPNFSKVTFA